MNSEPRSMTYADGDFVIDCEKSSSKGIGEG